MDDPLSAGIGAASSLIGGLLTNKNNKNIARETNAANKEIAMMNNQFNEKMLERQIAYNQQAWEQENEYNTAANQRKRLEAAGLNPYLMMSGGDAGTAGSIAGVSTPTASPYQAVGYNYDGSYFADAGNAAVTAIQWTKDYLMREEKQKQDLQKGQAEIDAINTSNAYLEQKIKNELALQAEQISGYKYDNKSKQTANQWQAPMLQAQFKGMRLDNERKSVDIDNAKINSDILKIQKSISRTNLKYLPAQLQVQLNTDLLKYVNQGNVNKQQIVDILSSYNEYVKSGVNLRILQETADNIISNTNWENSEENRWLKYGIKALGGAPRGISKLKK